MTIYGNLPPSTQGSNLTNNFFQNQFSNAVGLSPNANSIIVGYFQQITGDVDTGNNLAAAVIYTALQQGIDPVSVVEELKSLSDKNRLNSPTYANYISPNQPDTDVFVANSVTGGSWTTGNVNYSNPGPSTVYSSLAQVNAYLAMFLNLNRNSTSLLAISNSPQTNPYIQRAILA